MSNETENTFLLQSEMDYLNNAERRLKQRYLGEKVHFKNRKIAQPFNITRNISHDPAFEICLLIFTECVFTDSVVIGTHHAAGLVEFRSCTFESSVSFAYRNTRADQNCNFNSVLSITSESNEVVTLDSIKISKRLELFGSAKDVTLKNIVSKRGLEIILGVSSPFIEIKGVNSNSITLKNNLSHTDIKISDSWTENLQLDHFNDRGKVEIHSGGIGKFMLVPKKGQALDIRIVDVQKIDLLMISLECVSNLYIQGCNIKSCSLLGQNDKDSTIEIGYTTIESLEVNKVINNGKIIFRKLLPGLTAISFRSTNLGKTDFIHCDFSKASFEFVNSKITDIFSSQTQWPHKLWNFGNIDYGQAQLAFGQLAIAYQKQGDNIRSLEYSSRELAAHYKYIRLFSSFFFQKINLWLNYISNDFGRNWVRGSIFSFSVGLIFFTCLLISTGKYHFSMPNLDINLLPAYLKFMNPLRFFELEALFNNTKLEGRANVGSGAYLADFLGRIFVAYGYYQTIQAFRRFGKK